MTNTNQSDPAKRQATKSARTTIRRVQAHLLQSHVHLGAQQESAGFVDVITHPNSRMPSLNYVTPRASTAWVSGSHVEQGLDALREKDRLPRVRYAEGLYPPIFGRSLRELGLEAESETPILVHHVDADADTDERTKPPLPPHTRITRVTDQQGMGIWWYVWRNAYYDVVTGGAEPIFIGQEMRSVYLGYQIDLILYRHQFPIGVARITRHEDTAHLLALAILRELRTPELQMTLVQAALNAALDDGATLVFVAGDDEDDRMRLRQSGFVDMGSILSYADPDATTPADDSATLSLPVLVL